MIKIFRLGKFSKRFIVVAWEDKNYHSRFNRIGSRGWIVRLHKLRIVFTVRSIGKREICNFMKYIAKIIK
uniref:Uncharacterized protein n=1 Tax=viral metagenome TaxID=1070528 RepID=A0A6H1ZBT2_9ZZZZ